LITHSKPGPGKYLNDREERRARPRIEARWPATPMAV
jgi:hypothetical protein